MSELLNCTFTFHPVGQGLFYSGRIHDFNFVYDCGSISDSNYLNAAIEAYQRLGSKLDLLIISHFHEDHMNGVKALLRKTNGVNEVVLPYLYPAERLMVAAEYAIKNNLKVLDKDYISFLANPVRYMRNIDNDSYISFLVPSNANEKWGENVKLSDRAVWNPNNTVTISRNMDLVRIKNVKLRNHHSRYVGLWEFRFYCQSGRVLKSNIENKLKEANPPIEFESRKIQTAITKRLVDLKDIYYSLFNGSCGQNTTSVVCCHGPLPSSTNTSIEQEYIIPIEIFATSIHDKTAKHDDCIICICRRHPDKTATSAPFFPKQMLTGDANLEICSFKDHFKDVLPEVGLILLPHHGSSNNWRKQFFDIIPNCHIYIASCGLGNQYKHPGKDVLDSLVNAGKFLLTCNEVQGLMIEACL